MRMLQLIELTNELGPQIGARASSTFTGGALFAGLFWGSVGAALFLYGRKQGSIIPLVAGTGLIITGYFVASALWISLICSAILAATYFSLRDR